MSPIPPVSRAELTRAFWKIGWLSFGGPAGQIALMHRELIDDRGWVEEDAFLSALNVCHLLPGPEAQQLATWIGWRLQGLSGALIAGLLFVAPGAAIMLGLSILYTLAVGLDWFAALFLGVKAAVIAIIVQALIRIGKRALTTGFKRGLALAAFVALAGFDAPFPLVVIGAGAIGMAVAAARPDWLGVKPAMPGVSRPRPGGTIATIAAWGAVWALPLAIVWLTLGPDHVLWDIGMFFSQLAIVTFGGAYAVLAYMAQEAVTTFGWLAPGEMADGLGLAESTPGPLIMVTQFVGFLAAYRDAAPFTPLVAGIIGAGLTTWVTFAPCFLWIMTFAPWMERLNRAPRLKGGLAALTAAVVGVIANLALWFALHVLFREVRATGGGIDWPVPASFDWRAGVLAVVAGVLLFGLKRGVVTTLAVTAGLGLAAGLLA
ncbi:chromate efflux transporter [Sphingomonas gilva]|uniref:Chromate efflux transporter n=2 Tax=Sphingomonas gilva TaxID=2305907 RepID=A0A396RQA8_9SPHN|nr:chromate efflux transporter [Sphingomonas gilva]